MSYDINIVTDEDTLLNSIEEIDYTFVLYDTNLFASMKCMAADLIRDSGAKPFVLVSENDKSSDQCADVIPLSIEFKELEQLLKEN